MSPDTSGVVPGTQKCLHHIEITLLTFKGPVKKRNEHLGLRKPYLEISEKTLIIIKKKTLFGSLYVITHHPQRIIDYSSEQVEGPREDVGLSLHCDSESQEDLTLTYSLSPSSLCFDHSLCFCEE